MSDLGIKVGIFGPKEIQSILILAENADENTARDSCIAVGNLAVIAKNQEVLVQMGALPPLIRLLESEFVSVQMMTCRALYRLAANQDNQVRT